MTAHALPLLAQRPLRATAWRTTSPAAAHATSTRGAATGKNQPLSLVREPVGDRVAVHATKHYRRSRRPDTKQHRPARMTLGSGNPKRVNALTQSAGAAKLLGATASPSIHRHYATAPTVMRRIASPTRSNATLAGMPADPTSTQGDT